MTCYHPINGYKSATTNPRTGKRTIRFTPSGSFKDLPVQIPCGQCIGCRISKTREWALRCVHEAHQHEQNCFVTLTYSEENLPEDCSLSKRDIQLFLKRLRKKISPKRLRYFATGEYGDQYQRPHYHLCIFGHDFEDKTLWSLRDNVRLYRSQTLEKLWTVGFSTTGDVTFESAAYAARYSLKKINDLDYDKYNGKLTEEELKNWNKTCNKHSDLEHDKYGVIDEHTGEVRSKEKEFALMSRKPGIGAYWFERYWGDCFPKDYVTFNGISHPIPRYYQKKYQETRQFKNIKTRRIRKAYLKKDDNTPERLKSKEKVKQAQIKMLKRGIE